MVESSSDGRLADISSVGGYLGDAERRAGERHQTVLQIARLITERGEELCILRNVASGGLRADVYSQHGVGESVSFELRTGRRVSGKIVWVKESAIGVSFDRKVPILSYFAHQAIEQLGKRVRAPRIKVAETAQLRVGDDIHLVGIVDASQAGMCISTPHNVRVGAQCQLVLQGLDAPRGAIVRWVRDGQIGLQLLTPLSFREFGTWRCAVQSLPSA